MEKRILNYRVIISPDYRTGTKEKCYAIYVPTLRIATEGDTIEEALKNVKEAIELYVESLIEDKQEIPLDHIEKDIVTTAQVEISNSFTQTHA